jgi:general secretion pathway protein H
MMHFSTRPSPGGGFTLVELVVVLVILSVAALLVYPKLSATGDAGLRSSARSISATIRYLEDRAVATKSAYRMKINLNGSDIEILKVMPDGEEQHADDVLTDRALIADGISVSDVITSRLGKVSEGEVRIDFSPLGLDGFFTIHLRSPKGRFYTVQAYPRSGRVKVFENYSGSQA